MFEFMRSQITARRARSAWDRGVHTYAMELIDSLEECAAWEKAVPANLKECRRWLLNGAMDWTQYSEGGCALIYNKDIAERLCTASELKKTDNGRKDPNPSESWIDVQARALYQAGLLVERAFEAAQQFMQETDPADDMDDDDEVPAF